MDIEAILDKLFGSATDCIAYIKAGDWSKAAEFADHICAAAVDRNEDWIWEQFANITEVKPEWNSCSYGNVAYAIYHGAKFANRHAEIERVKQLF